MKLYVVVALLGLADFISSLWAATDEYMEKLEKYFQDKRQNWSAESTHKSLYLGSHIR